MASEFTQSDADKAALIVADALAVQSRSSEAAKLIAAAIKENTAALVAINQTLVSIGNKMSQDVQDLVAEVAAVKGVAASAVTFIQGIVAKLEAAQGDSAAIQAAIQDLKDGTQPLADAIAANPA